MSNGFDEKNWDVLNTALALENMGGDMDLFREVLVIYREDAPRKIRELDRAMKECDGERIRMAAHSLRGASANIGAVTVQQISSEIETACRDKHIDAVEELVDRLHKALSMLDSEISEKIGE